MTPAITSALRLIKRDEQYAAFVRQVRLMEQPRELDRAIRAMTSEEIEDLLASQTLHQQP